MLTLRRAGSWLVFPVMVAAALSATWALLQTAIAPNLIPMTLAIPMLGSVALFERLLPYRQEWNRNHNDVKPDALHLVIAQLLIPRLVTPLLSMLLIPATLAAQTWVGRDPIWPVGWHPLAQLFLMLLIAEFGRYWIHRAAHRFGPLWRLHAVHHSPKRLYWLNAARFHPLEKVLFLLPEVIPFILLKTPVETLTMYFVFNGLHGVFQHSNIDVRLGPLNYIFSMTELHRWHHSRVIGESDTNFGNNLSVWDLVFGTWFLPKGREVGVIGLYNPGYPETYMGHLKAPFMSPRIDKPADYDARPDFYDAQVADDARRAEDARAASTTDPDA